MPHCIQGVTNPCGKAGLTYPGAPSGLSRTSGGSEHIARSAICFQTWFEIYAIPCSIVWYFDILVIYTQGFHRVRFVDTPMYYIAAIFVKYCYTTGSWWFTVTPGFIQSVCLMSPSLSNFRSKGKFLKSRSSKNVVNSLQLLSKRCYFPHMDRVIVGDFIWKIPVAKVFQDPRMRECTCRLRFFFLFFFFFFFSDHATDHTISRAVAMNWKKSSGR